MKAYIMLSDHKDGSTDFSLKTGETVEVLDTVNKDKWLVRKQADKEKVRHWVIWWPRTFRESSAVHSFDIIIS